MYRQKAIYVLDVVKDERFKWLFDVAKVQGDAPNAMKIVALRICELKPTAREAVQTIRNFRTGRKSAGSVRQLETEILRVLDDYVSRHPAMLYGRVCDALSSVLDITTELAMKTE